MASTGNGNGKAHHSRRGGTDHAPAGASEGRRAVHQGFVVRGPEHRTTAQGARRPAEPAAVDQRRAKAVGRSDWRPSTSTPRRATSSARSISRSWDAGLFRLENIPEPASEPFLLVNCPSILFPFVRRIAADLTREAASRRCSRSVRFRDAVSAPPAGSAGPGRKPKQEELIATPHRPPLRWGEVGWTRFARQPGEWMTVLTSRCCPRRSNPSPGSSSASMRSMAPP